ncbi:hypothetical protein GCM10022220_14120 [Actinocatenispora rupis]|uniref:Uncharacterized protein n=2 Tax=Actinocatenispora rupis TaxID=519421 RepID=A0A8J3IXQ5_9ACTN|nr:hypothetical protein Aru02nite_15390 [Actinocatenispora rupis]
MAAAGSAYCVVMVGLTFVPWLPPFSGWVVLPAVVTAAPCFFTALFLGILHSRGLPGSSVPYLIGSVPTRLRVAGLAVAFGCFLVIVLTAPSINRFGVGVVDGHHGHRPDTVIGRTEYERQLRYDFRVGFCAAGWFTALPGLMIAGAAQHRAEGEAGS